MTRTPCRAPEVGHRPVIGILPSLKPDLGAVQVAEQYEDALAAMGAAPVLLPLVEDVEVYRTLFPLLDGFLLSGGTDLDPAQYGADRTYEKLEGLTPRRDAIERLILGYAYRADLPVLGICRGMQMLNVFFGGTLYLDLRDQFAPVPGSGMGITHRQRGDYASAIHTVNITPGSRLFQILHREVLEVNSMHHQGVRAVAPLARASAFAPDGLVEAIEICGRSFMMGVQWHPEYFAGREQMGPIFAALVDEAGMARGMGRAGAPLTATSLAGTACLNMSLDEGRGQRR